MAPQPLEMAQLTVALYANVAARADVAERWEMMQRLLPPGIAVVKVDPSECASDAEAVEKLAAADAIVCLPYGGVVVDDALASQLRRAVAPLRTRCGCCGCCCCSSGWLAAPRPSTVWHPRFAARRSLPSWRLRRLHQGGGTAPNRWQTQRSAYWCHTRI